MYCWNCGAANADDNSFCGKCGKRIVASAPPIDARPSRKDDESVTQASVPPVTQVPINDVAPLPSNPLVEEPRSVHDSPRTLAQMEIERPVAPTAPSNGASPARANEDKITEFPPLPKRSASDFRERDYTLPPNRITGPSFLGLSDEPSSPSGSDYLLEDDEPKRSHWRAWVAVAVLALLGVLIYKQWSAVQATAKAVAEKGVGAAQRIADTQQTPAPVPTHSDQVETAEAKPPAPPAATDQNANSAVDKPEGDHASDSSASEPAKTDTDSSAKDEKSAVSETDKSSDHSDADTQTEAKAPAKAKAKASERDTDEAASAGPAYNDQPVNEAEKYLRGHGVQQDCSRAISLLRSSARDGNPKAQVKLGALYATGQCVTQDRAAAYQWLARAQEAQPHNGYLQRTMNSLWANMTPEERDRITH